MTRQRQVSDVTCDVCQLGSFMLEDSFVQVGDVDLCRWCHSARSVPGGQVASGRCVVTYSAPTAFSWSCSCGMHYWPVLISQGAFEAVPDLVAAAAVAHVQGFNRTARRDTWVS